MDHTSCTNTHYDVTDLWVTLLKRTGTYRFAKQADSTNICGWFWLSMKRLENWWLSSLEIPLTAILDMSPPPIFPYISSCFTQYFPSLFGRLQYFPQCFSLTPVFRLTNKIRNNLKIRSQNWQLRKS